ncbi:hypothetical protein ATO11_20890 [Pseudaestuariivita atlantica]|uniref:Uncharacterized protein n=1 Tax=Pseudaestuariivita atlantica TaxID=1317121 RepID=A0A0L1JJ39_9RHOB|nr:hypothetical protein ATO11_20890 [Pseudaestuariivita atlantica]
MATNQTAQPSIGKFYETLRLVAFVVGSKNDAGIHEQPLDKLSVLSSLDENERAIVEAFIASKMFSERFQFLCCYLSNTRDVPVERFVAYNVS